MTTWRKQVPSVADILALAAAHPVPAISRGPHSYWAIRHRDGTRPRIVMLGVRNGKAVDCRSGLPLVPNIIEQPDQVECHPMSRDLDKVDWI